jgi:hypothetical protein
VPSDPSGNYSLFRTLLRFEVSHPPIKINHTWLIWI